MKIIKRNGKRFKCLEIQVPAINKYLLKFNFMFFFNLWWSLGLWIGKGFGFDLLFVAFDFYIDKEQHNGY